MTGAPRDLPGADLIASRAESECPERERVPRNLLSNKGGETTMQITECPERERVPRNLPGADLVAAGIEALRRGELTVEALLVAVGARRLRDAGLEVPAPPELPDSPELLLYAAMGAAHPCDAHSRYNGLIRRLVSFERALEGVDTHARAPGSLPRGRSPSTAPCRAGGHAREGAELVATSEIRGVDRRPRAGNHDAGNQRAMVAKGQAGSTDDRERGARRAHSPRTPAERPERGRSGASESDQSPASSDASSASQASYRSSVMTVVKPRIR